MILDHLEVRNVRNVRNLELRLSPSTNFITGPNGAGKTTLLETIHLLVRGRSFRSGGLNSLVTFGEQELLVTAKGSHEGHSMRIGLRKTRDTKVRMRINESDVRQVSQIAATIPLQTFLPDLPDLVFGSPSGRRQWLDWCVFHTDNNYLRTLRKYQRVLRQRNAALRNQSTDLRGWTIQLADHADTVTRVREKIFSDVNECFVEVLAQLAPNIRIKLDYVRGWDDSDLLEGLEKDRQYELKYGVTRLGPHRSDVQVRMLDLASGRDAGAAARILSRGQGKAVASAMKLAQVEHLKSRSVPSVVLIDDFASEFDDEYGSRFFGTLLRTGSQVVATTTQESDIIKLGRNIADAQPLILRIQNGRLAGT